jgi:Ca2+-binding RTX toxin-like protein
MSHGRLLRRMYLFLAALIILVTFSAFAASVVVPTTRLTNQSRAIMPNTLKPTACSAITLTSIIYCPASGGACNGTNANELILGSPSADTIQGKGGADCILAGGGDDSVSGSKAKDVCIGGPGTDTFAQCETTIQ